MAPRSKKAQKLLTIKPSGRTTPRRRTRKTNAEKFEDLCRSQTSLLSGSAFQVFEILEDYTKHHLISCEPAVFRELLRTTLKFLPQGIVKTKIRGILAYYTRSSITKTFMKLAQILETVSTVEDITTFKSEKEVPFDRIVDQTTILRISGKPQLAENFEILNGKVERLARKNKSVNSQNVMSSQSLPDSEPPFWARKD